MDEKTKKIIYVICGVVLVACVIWLLIDFKIINFGGKDKPNDNPPVANDTEPEPVPEPTQTSKLTIFDENSNSRPFVIMINNQPGAIKAQTGLNDAYAVYEFPIEGGMSRSLAFFKDKETAQIGTVRSARQYHPYYALEHDAIYVHWGSNHPGSDVISSTKINHIDANSNGGPFFRKNPFGLATEHTGYTSLVKLKSFAQNKKWRLTTEVKPPIKYSYENIDLSTMSGAKPATTIDMNYSGSYKLKYTYNAEKGVYERHYNGKDHKDYLSGEIFTAKNIIVEFVGIGSTKGWKDAAGTNYLDITNVKGSGKGWYITNGYAREITWSKSEKTAQTVYKYTDGTEVNINDGRTYVNFFNKSKSISIK